MGIILGPAAWPGSGEPPEVLLDGSPADLVDAPAGGPPMLILRHPVEVAEFLASRAVVLANRRACPLTGAELKHPGGGLLVMDGLPLAALRSPVMSLFSRAAAATPAARVATGDLLARLGRRPAADLIGAYVAPYIARLVCQALGRPLRDWDYLQGAGQVAFGLVTSPDAVPVVTAMWDDLYSY